MIKIIIATDGEKVLDTFKDKNVTLLEVRVTLLRLKQIEQKLIDKQFDNDFESEEVTK